jgi:thiol-disulfide isomerase/thioredoxin
MKSQYAIQAFLILVLLSFASQGFTDAKIVEPTGALNSSVEAELQEGRWELVMFWATYCSVCKKDFKKIAEFMQENSSIPMTIIGVVTDGIEERKTTDELIEIHNLAYTHVATDYPKSNEFYQEVTGQRLIGTPSYLLYDKSNKLVAFNANAIDLDALEIFVGE